MKPDIVNHPPHYTSHPSGMECIQLSRLFPFSLGNFIKYLWRSGEKDDVQQERRKARWYLADYMDNMPDIRFDIDPIMELSQEFISRMEGKPMRPEDEILVNFFKGFADNSGPDVMLNNFLGPIFEDLDQLIEDNEDDAPQTANQ